MSSFFFVADLSSKPLKPGWHRNGHALFFDFLGGQGRGTGVWKKTERWKVYHFLRQLALAGWEVQVEKRVFFCISAVNVLSSEWKLFYGKLSPACYQHPKL